MHDPKFEKEVQQKMEELLFTPSEGVWSRVESKIRKKRERRLAPVFWMFLTGALVVGAAGIYFLHAPAKPSPAAIPTIGGTLKDRHAATANPARQLPPLTTIGSSNKAGASEPAGLTPGAGQTHNTAQIPSTGQTNSTLQSQNHAIPKSQNALIATTEKTSPRNNPKISQSQNTSIPKSQDPNPSLADSDPQGVAKFETTDLSAWKLTGATLAPVDKGAVPDLTAGVKMPDAARMTAGIPGPGANKIAKKTILYKKSVWEAGFTAGAGISSAKQGLVGSKSMALDAPSYASVAANAVPLAARPQTYTSNTDPGFSFFAGIFAMRPVSKRISLTAGLNLHYYSTKVEIVQKTLILPATGANSLFSPQFSPQASASSSQFQGSAASFNDRHASLNQYYFLELPVSMQVQLNHSSRTPIFWEAGLSLARLMSADVLYYDANSGVYYKDGRSVSNGTQLNASTALMIGLSFRGVRMQLGPQLQYGLTSLANENASGAAKHMYYGGIKLNIIPGKRK
jgi:hypothetical protein